MTEPSDYEAGSYIRVRIVCRVARRTALSHRKYADTCSGWVLPRC